MCCPSRFRAPWLSFAEGVGLAEGVGRLSGGRRWVRLLIMKADSIMAHVSRRHHQLRYCQTPDCAYIFRVPKRIATRSDNDP